MSFVGLDIGTSAVKAVLVNENQEIVASSVVSLVTHRPRPAWSEQDPEAWWRATLAVLNDLSASALEAWHDVAAIGLSGQMHAAVLIDRNDQIIRPAILWNDSRALGEADDLNAAFPEIGRIAGISAMAGFTAPKLLWLNRHEPGSIERAATVLPAKDFIRLRLTGERATDMSEASGTLLLDIARRRWFEPLIHAVGLDLKQLPEVKEGPDSAGFLKPDIAGKLHLTRRVVIAAGAGDVAAAALGLGVINDGDGLISLGTSAQYLVAADAHRPAPETAVHAYAHALPERWFQMAALLNGASCLSWAASLIQDREVADLLAETERAYCQPSELLFLPYLSGERTPHNDPDAKGVLYGLTPAAKASDIIQSVLEGVGFALADGQDSLEAAGTRARTLAITGGGARSRFWGQVIASILDRDLTAYRDSGFAAALGASRLARICVTGEPARTVCRVPEGGTAITPDSCHVRSYQERHRAFRALYLALRENFQRG